MQYGAPLPAARSSPPLPNARSGGFRSRRVGSPCSRSSSGAPRVSKCSRSVASMSSGSCAAQLAGDLLEQRRFHLGERRAKQLVGELESARGELGLHFREQCVELGARQAGGTADDVGERRECSVRAAGVATSRSHLMSVELVAAVAIEAIALAALLAPHGVGVDDLGDALVAAEKLRHVGGEVDQHVPAPRGRRLIHADQHGLAAAARRARRARRDGG